MKKIRSIAYIGLFLLICLIPSLGLFLKGEEASSENRRLASFPELRTEEGWNDQFLQDMGTYFEDHFGFRNELVTGYGLLTGKLFGTSSQKGVVTGTDGWLYYADSLGDYLGTEQMTERQLFDAAHTLAMVQEYAESLGIRFAFTVAPNKNSLYGEHMPYYYQGYRQEENNFSRIQPWLASEGVNYVDLYGPLAERDEVLYHKTDSHWNNQGAAVAAELLLTALDQEHSSYEEREYEKRTDFDGDLAAMVYPSAVEPEEEIYYDPEPSFTYVEEVESNFEPKISTVGSGASGSLVMYRDSFANALLPFMAEAFQSAFFSRGVPYSLSDLYTYAADALVIERAERFLPELAKNPPSMAAPVVSSETLAETEFQPEIQDLTETEQGPYTIITGTLAEGSYETDSRIYLRVNGLVTYEAFPVSLEDGQEGFSAMLVTELLEPEGNVYEMGLSKNI